MWRFGLDYLDYTVDKFFTDLETLVGKDEDLKETLKKLHELVDDSYITFDDIKDQGAEILKSKNKEKVNDFFQISAQFNKFRSYNAYASSSLEENFDYGIMNLSPTIKNEDEFYEFKLKKLVKALEEEKDNLLYNNNLFSNWLGKTGICLSNFLGCLTSDLATIEKVEPFVEDDYEIIQNKHLESISEKRTLNIFNIPEELLEKFNNNQIKKNSIIETLNDIQSNLEKSNISQQRTDLYALTVEISELRAQNPEPEFIDPWL